MPSFVFFKIKFSNVRSRIAFDGTEIGVFDLKREIITAIGLGDGTNFDLTVRDEATGEELTEDTATIPRSSTVVVQRRPADRPGRGNAARYVSGKAPVTAKNAYRLESNVQDGPGNSSGVGRTTHPASSEAARLAQLLDASWTEQRGKMAEDTAVPRIKRNIPAGEPPATYTCHRCRNKGHWIQACPTNDDASFVAKPKIPRTTGIPTSHLRTVIVENSGEDGLTDTAKAHAGLLMNANGDYVVARSDKVSWERFQAKANASTSKQQTVEEAGTKKIQELGLQCTLCQRLFVDPVKTPCCETTYCWNCIETALVQNDLSCPHCSQGSVVIDDLVTDQETVDKIKSYQTEKPNAQTPTTQNGVPATTDSPKASKETSDQVQAKGTDDVKSTNAAKSSPSPTLSVSSQSGSQSGKTQVLLGDESLAKPNKMSPAPEPKKRVAEDELPNDRVANGPAKSTSKPPPTMPSAMNQDRYGPVSGNPQTGPASQMPGNQFNQFFPGMPNMMGSNGQLNPMMMMGPGMSWNNMIGMGNMGNIGNMGMANGNGNGSRMGSNGNMFPNGMAQQNQYLQQYNNASGGRSNWAGQWNGMNMGGGNYNNGGQYPPQHQQMYNNGGGAYSNARNGQYANQGNQQQQYQQQHQQQQYQQRQQHQQHLQQHNPQIKPNGMSQDYQQNIQSQHSQPQSQPQSQQQQAQSSHPQQQSQAAPTTNAMNGNSQINTEHSQGEDSPYFRTAVNPSRQMNRRRLRRTDFTELQ